MLLRVTQYEEPVLREGGAAVETFDDPLRQLASDMLETMYASEGIGLAAQQVGRALRLCVVDIQLPQSEVQFEYSFDGRSPPVELIMPLVMANPEVAPLPGPDVPYEEGCLSFPDIRGDVVRPERVAAEFQDLSGAPHRIEAGGILARVIQHEVDHLNGVLFIDRMEPHVLKAVESKVKKLRRSTRDFLKAQRRGGRGARA